MALLTLADYPAIRAALDATLDTTILPDSVIAQPIYHRAAELEVLARDPDAAGRTGDAATRVRNAAILRCAALLAPVIPRLTREGTDVYTYDRQVVNWATLAETLRARADAELAAVLTPGDPTQSLPTMFTLARGQRGR